MKIFYSRESHCIWKLILERKSLLGSVKAEVNFNIELYDFRMNYRISQWVSLRVYVRLINELFSIRILSRLSILFKE